MSYQMYLYREQHVTPVSKELSDETASDEAIAWPEYPTMVRETIGEWWNAFPIHRWFADRNQFDPNILDTEEECSVRELEQLLSAIDEVLEASELVQGKVSWGYSLTDSGPIHHYKDGKVIADPSTAIRLLPIPSGWDRKYDYDQYYVKQLQEVKTALQVALSSPPHMSFTYAVR